MSRERDFSMDFVRVWAAGLVIAVHFIAHTGFYDQPLIGPTMAVYAWLRMLFLPCVPLFLMLSGYFCIERRWSRGHLRGLLKVLLVYLLAAVLCLLFRAYWMKEPMRFSDALKMILAFTAAPYGWYVAMYAGLYLLMPFLNTLWRALTGRERGILLLVLLLLVSLPAVTNLTFQILPDWWIPLYPAAYYLLGAWLREPPERLTRLRGGVLLLGWLVPAAAAAALRWVFAEGGTFTWMSYVDYNSPFVVAEALCAFSLLRRFRGTRLPAMARRAVSRAARLSLPIFLTSYIFDSLLYPVLNGRFPTLKGRLPFLPLIVLAVLLCSALLGQAVDAAAGALLRLLPERERSKE